MLRIIKFERCSKMKRRRIEMKKNPERTEARKMEIVKAALELFFEKGYEGTSVRMIQERIGKQVGGFYYYFDSKDDVFDAALDFFFASYEKEMDEIIENGKDNPSDTLTKYFEYIHEATQEFRRNYVGKLQLGVLGAIREHTLEVMHKYVLQILGIYQEKGMLTNASASMEVAANFLTYGVGGSILYQSKEQYLQQEEEIKEVVKMLLNSNRK